MNKLSEITTDLEISKRLKEKGFKQDGLFLWDRTWKNERQWDVFLRADYDLEDDADELYRALIAAEILKELPIIINGKWMLNIFRDINCGYIVTYTDENFCVLNDKIVKNKKIYVALSEYWEYLHDNNLLKGGESNG